MDILVISVAPIFPANVHGGAQRILDLLIRDWADRGHHVTILCARRRDNDQPFQLASGVCVYPSLQFRPTFPAAYWTHPYNLLDITRIVDEYLQRHDILYVHDAQYLLPRPASDKPMAVAFRNFVYPETMIAAYNLDADRLLFVSSYIAECFRWTAGQLYAGIDSRMQVIDNGYDLDVYRRVPTRPWRQKLGIRPDEIALLYPHRPDSAKGIWVALEALEQIKREWVPAKLLMPEHMDRQQSADIAEYFNTLVVEIEKRNLVGDVIFHPWLAPAEMPAYYSSGDVTLSVGNYIEGSNSVAIESILCGTPAIVTRVAAKRTVGNGIPGIVYVDYGDVEQIVSSVLDLVSGRIQIDADQARAVVGERYPLATMLDAYIDVLTTTTRLPSLQADSSRLHKQPHRWRLAPWCVVTKRGIYNDYTATYTDDGVLVTLVREVGWEWFDHSVAEQIGVILPKLHLACQQKLLIADFS